MFQMEISLLLLTILILYLKFMNNWINNNNVIYAYHIINVYITTLYINKLSDDNTQSNRFNSKMHINQWENKTF